MQNEPSPRRVQIYELFFKLVSWSEKTFFSRVFSYPRVEVWVLFPLVGGEKNPPRGSAADLDACHPIGLLWEFFSEVRCFCPNDDIVFSADVLVVEIVDDHGRVGAHVPDGSVRCLVHAIYDVGIITVQLYGNTDIRSLFYIVRVCDGS